MDFSEGTALEIVERLCSAYGVTTQKALAESIGVPAANVSNWVQRDSVPGSAFVKCALDTGSDLYWLTTGKLANTSLKQDCVIPQGKALYDEIMSNGGRPVLRRIMDAYGFTMQKQLCDLLEISSGTVSTWVRRGYFPGDVVVACALDTGVALRWLATGKGEINECPSSINSKSTIIIPKLKLESGKLKEIGTWSTDASLFNAALPSASYIEGVKYSWLVDSSENKIGNGRWVINVDDSYDVFDIICLPGGKLDLSNEKIKFECKQNDIDIFGVVIFTLERHV